MNNGTPPSVGWEEEDRYLSTDDEGTGTPLTKAQSQAQRDKQEAVQRAELARARQVAHKRIGQHEQNQTKRAFAVLDNVSERESPSWKSRSRRVGTRFDPALNPHIDNEAAEAGDSDSDLLGDDSLSASSEEEEDNRPEKNRPHLHLDIKDSDSTDPSVPTRRIAHLLGKNSSANSDSDNEDTMYEDFSASREAVQAQIVAEAMAQNQQHCCDSSSSEEEQSESSSTCATDINEEEEGGLCGSVDGGYDWW